MILTGRAKEDFIDYLWQSKFNKDDYKEYEDYINNQKESHTYADIIEWFDSVGIYTDAQMVSGFDFENNKVHSPVWFMNVFSEKYCYTDDVEEYPSRRDATIKAILKANEIYNESKN